MILAVGSVRGAPGVTSWTMLLAAAWPRDDRRGQRVVLEADPDGGVLAARYGVGVDPGAVSFASAIRRGVDQVLPVGEHIRVVDERMVLMPGPESADSAASVWRDAAATTAAAIASNAAPFDWFVDCGRLRPDSPSLAFAREAQLVVLIVGSSTEDLLQAPATVRMLEAQGGRVAVVMRGRPTHDVAEVKRFVGCEHVYEVPRSRNLPAETAAVINTARARRGWLWRGALGVAANLNDVARSIAPVETGAP